MRADWSWRCSWGWLARDANCETVCLVLGQGVARAELQGECNTTRSENEAVQWWAHGPEQARFTRAVRETPIHFNEIAQERKVRAAPEH